MLSFGLTLGSLAYKQQVLSSGAIESGYAFYAADSGLECALYADQQLNTFDYASAGPGLGQHPVPIVCAGNVSTELSYSYDAVQLTVTDEISLSANSCVDVTVYKRAAGGVTVYAQGYDVSCATLASPTGKRIVSRGITSSY